MAIRPYDSKQSNYFMFLPQEVLGENHLCFVIDEIVEKLDLSEFYKGKEGRGAPWYDPKLLIKVLFYGYATGVFSARKLMKNIKENVAFMYLARQQRPDFRTISDFRKDNKEKISRLFIEIIKVCEKLGLIKKGLLIIDGLKIRANANNNKSYSKEKLKKMLEEIKKDIEEAIKKDKEEDQVYGEDKSGEELPEEIKKKQVRLNKIEQAIREDKEKVNLTDKDAKYIKGNGLIETNYNCQVGISEDGIIVTGQVSNEAADQKQLVKQVEQAEKNIGEVKEVIADSGYYTVKNIQYLEEKNIRCYIPDSEEARKKKDKYKDKRGKISKEEFRYLKEEDEYECPEGRRLKKVSRQNNRGLNIYRGQNCKGCRLRRKCVRGNGERMISRYDIEEKLKEVKARLRSKEGKEKYKLRCKKIEPIFGHFKKNLGFRQFYLRGLEKVNLEFKLLCIGYNLLKIYKHLKEQTGKGKKISYEELYFLCLESVN